MEEGHYSYRIEASGERLLVALSGDLDIFSVEQLDLSLEDWLVASFSNITFDCEKVDFVDSSFLRYLMTLQKRLGDVRVINASRTVLRIMQITGLAEVFMRDARDFPDAL